MEGTEAQSQREPKGDNSNLVVPPWPFSSGILGNICAAFASHAGVLCPSLSMEPLHLDAYWSLLMRNGSAWVVPQLETVGFRRAAKRKTVLTVRLKPEAAYRRGNGMICTGMALLMPWQPVEEVCCGTVLVENTRSHPVALDKLYITRVSPTSTSPPLSPSLFILFIELVLFILVPLAFPHVRPYQTVL